jgi:hypothetical protein
MEEAAVKYAGEGAALSHATSGAGYRFSPASAKIHVSVPAPRQVTSKPGLAIHRSRTLGPEDIVGDPPRTTPERTVLDLLDGIRSADAALALIANAGRSRRTTADRLRAALLGSTRTRWRATCLEALDEVGRGAHSLLEIKDGRIRRRHGLPEGRRQVRRDKDGVEYLDVVIEEWDLHVEVDGRLGHEWAEESWRDMRRDNRSEVQQLRHLRYGWADVVHRPCEVAIEQGVILRQQGWQGVFKHCRDCPAELPPELC